MNNFPGIYSITFLKEDKKYIGSSFNIRERWNKHLFQLRHHIHDNEYIQESYDKYGKENLKFELIQELDRNRQHLIDMELYWIIFYNSFIDDGGGYNKIRGDNYKYNCSKETLVNIINARPDISGEKNSFFGHSHTDITKNKLSLLEQGKKVNRNIPMSSKYAGVYWNKKLKKWRAHICINANIFHLGYYHNEISAANAYNKKAIELYGENAKINILVEEDLKSAIEEDTYIKERIKESRSSQYRGLHRKNKTGSWEVTFFYVDRKIYVGSFTHETEAALAYNEAVTEFFGHKAKLNNISQEEIENLWNIE